MIIGRFQLKWFFRKVSRSYSKVNRDLGILPFFCQKITVKAIYSWKVDSCQPQVTWSQSNLHYCFSKENLFSFKKWYCKSFQILWSTLCCLGKKQNCKLEYTASVFGISIICKWIKIQGGWTSYVKNMKVYGFQQIREQN